MTKSRVFDRLALCVGTAGVLVMAGTAHAQTSFTSMTVLGDSYADAGRAPQIAREIGKTDPFVRAAFENFLQIYPNGAATNGVLYVDVLQRTYGLPSSRVLNLAVGGARSDDTNSLPPLPGLTQQRQEFQASVAAGRGIGPTDLVVLHMGGNDILGVMRGDFNLMTADQAAALGRGRAQFIGQTIGEFVAAGARTVVFGNQVDTSTFRPSVTSAFPAANVALAPAFSQAYQEASIASMVPFARQGVRIVYFDDNLFSRTIIANPNAYGFTNVSSDCLSTPGCFKASFAEQNKFFSFDGTHLTSAAYELMGRSITNILAAPLAIAPQADVAQAAASAFAGTLFARLDAQRYPVLPRSVGAAYAAYNADRATRPAAPETASFPISVYAQGVYGHGTRNDRSDTQGFRYDSGGAIVGAEVRAAPGLLFGVALNYLDTQAALSGGGQIKVKSYQFAGYGSFTGPNLFADAVVSFGRNDIDNSRPGLVEGLRGSANGDSVTAGIKAGYLFDAGSLRLGPIASLNYARAQNNGYTERGEPFLTLTVGGQTAEALTGGAGAQLRTRWSVGAMAFNPYINLTAERDFRGNARAILIGQTVAPTLATPWRVGQSSDQVYGKVVAGLGADFGSGVQAVLSAGSTFARNGGNDLNVSGSFNYRF